VYPPQLCHMLLFVLEPAVSLRQVLLTMDRISPTICRHQIKLFSDQGKKEVNSLSRLNVSQQQPDRQIVHVTSRLRLGPTIHSGVRSSNLPEQAGSLYDWRCRLSYADVGYISVACVLTCHV